MVEIKMRKISMVKPAEKTPRRSVPLTLLDRLFAFPLYNSVVHLYKPKGLVDAAALWESLSRTLVHFYPMAGRYRLDCNGIMEIDCNDEGVLFLEAQTGSILEDLGDFAPSQEMSRLTPSVDRTEDISAYPITAVQLTYFRCGGVSLGICVEHRALDGISAFHAIRSWSETARGLDISVPPFFDRTSVLRPRDPPRTKFDHPEYPRHSPAEKTSRQVSHTKVSIFRVTTGRLKEMKAVASKQSNGHTSTNYTGFELLAGHIWRCVCKARGVGGDEETVLSFPVNARFNRLIPKLPRGFFGNALFRGRAIARAGDLVSKPLWYAASKIHERLVLMDNEYLRSAIDHLALLPDLSVAKSGPQVFESFQITSWVNLGLNDADFGWGPPVHSGPGWIVYEKAYIFSNDHDGCLSVTIALQPKHMEIFEKLFYEFEGKNLERECCV